MDIISRKYINEGFNSKAYIINDDYILLDGVNQNSYKNYQIYVNVINQISNVKSLEIPRIIELIEPCEEYPNGALIYKMIKGHTFRKEHIEIVNLDNIAKKLAEFMDELYEIRVDFDKDEYILKSATKLFSVLLASKRPLITELADKLRLKYPLLPTISPCPTMRLEAIRSIIPISCRRYPKSV